LTKKEGIRVIFSYSLTHLAFKDKVRFYYALKGRDGKSGIIKECNIEQISKGVLLVEESHASKVEEFLRFWKCAYRKKEVSSTEKEGWKKKQIFNYKINHLQVKDKVRFYYALKGRDGKSGIIKDYKIEQLAKGVLLVSEKYIEHTEGFLKFWKCDYNKNEVFMHES